MRKKQKKSGHCQFHLRTQKRKIRRGGFIRKRNVYYYEKNCDLLFTLSRFGTFERLLQTVRHDLLSRPHVEGRKRRVGLELLCTPPPLCLVQVPAIVQGSSVDPCDWDTIEMAVVGVVMVVVTKL